MRDKTAYGMGGRPSSDCFASGIDVTGLNVIETELLAIFTLTKRGWAISR